jgi:hypothetical protein
MGDLKGFKVEPQALFDASDTLASIADGMGGRAHGFNQWKGRLDHSFRQLEAEAGLRAVFDAWIPALYRMQLALGSHSANTEIIATVYLEADDAAQWAFAHRYDA